jgi:DNA invertase Pin-like site-specific DNA recombinase
MPVDGGQPSRHGIEVDAVRPTIQVRSREDRHPDAAKGNVVAALVAELTGGRWDRPELHRLLDQLRSDDTLVVWKLDRLSRSLKNLLTILERIDSAGARFRSLTEAIDTSGPAGRMLMLMQMLGSFSEFEREMIRERTRAGLREARAKGRVPGRKPKITAEQQKEIVNAVSSGRKTSAQIARLFKIHRATVSRMVSQARVGA